ncbi:MAG: acetate/propionate family kinase [Eubacteriales bacterium]|jgi:acetate kinase
MKILVINAGSSSLKYQLIDMNNKLVMAKGLCERIGIDGKLKHQVAGKDDYKLDAPMPNHAAAIQIVLDALVSPEHGCISDVKEIEAVGHRVVHGGENFTDSALITDKVLKAIEECIEVAPLHNPPNLTGIRACTEVLGPDVPQVAVFDTAFHQTMPGKAYMYPLPYEYYEQYKVRKYGFHGTSHKYVSLKAAEMLGKRPDEVNIITCHMGNGSSIAAVQKGKCIDTTMGFTPLDGTLMGTRCGSIDPAVVTFLMKKENLTPDEMDAVMNKKSGALGLSGVSSDFRDVKSAADEGSKRAQLVLDMLVYEVQKYIGAFNVAMGGTDAIVFTAGVGENDVNFRANVVQGLGCLGITLDEKKNQERGKMNVISGPDSKVKVLVIPTDEEMMIAMDTQRLVSGR